MNRQVAIVFFLSFFFFACGYTVLKREDKKERDGNGEGSTVSTVAKFNLESLDSLLVGSWRGRGECFRANQYEGIHRLTFSTEGLWEIETERSIIRGKWQSSLVEGAYQVEMNSRDDWRAWNGPCAIFINGNNMSLTFNRPWQTSCRLKYIRIVELDSSQQ